MAIATTAEDMLPGDGGYISDESSFYGDEATQAELEAAAASFSPTMWRALPRFDPNAIAAANLANPQYADRSKPVILHNPGEGQRNCRQLKETISEFLQRLPPRTTRINAVDGWIWIHNPHVQPERKADFSAFDERGRQILADLTAQQGRVEKENEGRPKSTISRKLTPLRNAAMEELYTTAKETDVRTGKWMLFPSAENVNKAWRVVAESTAAGDLGTTAKVAPLQGDESASGDKGARLICVYNEDFDDKKEVEKVLGKLVKLDLVKPGEAIYYKTDAWTHLDLKSGNAWGIPASLHSSKEFLAKKK